MFTAGKNIQPSLRDSDVFAPPDYPGLDSAKTAEPSWAKLVPSHPGLKMRCKTDAYPVTILFLCLVSDLAVPAEWLRGDDYERCGACSI